MNVLINYTAGPHRDLNPVRLNTCTPHIPLRYETQLAAYNTIPSWASFIVVYESYIIFLLGLPLY